MQLKIMTFNICHGADYRDLLEKNTSPNGPLSYGYEKTNLLAAEENFSEIHSYWNKSVNLEQVAQVIRRSDCDIIGLNEVRGEGPSAYYSNQAEILAKLTDRYYFFAPAVEFPNEGSYGIALLSRFPIKSGEILPIPFMEGGENREPRRLLKAVIAAENDVTVYVSHFGGHPREQELAVSAFLEDVNAVKTPVLLMGDFNTTPKSGILNPVYDVMEECFSETNPFTFPSFAPVRKIDYIFASKPARFFRQEVIPVVISDHYPLVAQVDF